MLTQETMEHLLNNEWFNDEIVNSYLATLFKENPSVGLLDSYTLAHNKHSKDATVVLAICYSISTKISTAKL